MKEQADMTISTLRNAQDPYLRIARQRFGIDVEAAMTSGDPAEIARVQTLLDALAEAYELGFEDGEHYVTSNDVPMEECVTTLDTAFLLAIHRGDADLRFHVIAEIARRAGTGNDPLAAFAPPLHEQRD
ncbi:MAG: hypothetical protein ACOY82_02595 [Pseudomonadota bacterium]